MIDQGEKNHSLFRLGGLQVDLSEAFHKKIDLLTDNSLDPDFRDRIKKDEVMIYDSQSEG